MSSNTPPSVIAIIANYPKGTGYAWWLMECFWNEISNTAASQGWKSVVVYPISSEDNEINKSSFAPSHLESFLSNGTLGDALKIYRLIRRLHIRSLYLTDRPYRSWKYLLLRLSGIKSIIVHDHTPGDRPPVEGIIGLTKRLLNHLPWITASLYIAISPLMRQRHILNARIPSSRIVTVTNGIIVSDLIANARELLLAKFELAPDCYIVGAIGRLNPYKRFDFAIKCIGKLSQDNPKSKPVLILIGDGPDRPRLEELADRQGPSCKVIFTGQINNVWSILCGFDTVIHPSAGEGLSLAILEAMAAARPVLVPSIPSVSQTIEHYSNGLIYQEGSLDDAESLLYELLHNNKLRTELGINARRKVLEDYQLDRAIDDFKKTVLPVLFQP